MDNKTHWKKLVNPLYLGAYSLNEGQDMTITIESVSREIVVSAGGKKEECTVAKIKGNKPMIINPTNCKTITKLYDSPYIEDWVGKQITIFASTAKLSGDIVECLRIRPFVTPLPKPTITDERLNNAIAAVKKGDYTKEQIFKSYALNDEQLERVKSC